jgi:hypothetical protein
VSAQLLSDAEENAHRGFVNALESIAALEFNDIDAFYDFRLTKQQENKDAAKTAED